MVVTFQPRFSSLIFVSKASVPSEGQDINPGYAISLLPEILNGSSPKGQKIRDEFSSHVKDYEDPAKAPIAGNLTKILRCLPIVSKYFPKHIQVGVIAWQGGNYLLTGAEQKQLAALKKAGNNTKTHRFVTILMESKAYSDHSLNMILQPPAALEVKYQVQKISVFP